MAPKDYTVRPATPEDIPSVNTIHKYYVENTVITFVMEANSDEAAQANYDKVRNEGLPYVVAEDNNSKAILGYSYLSSFRGVKPGYRHSLELSLFCHPDHVRKGVGREILLRVIEILKEPQNFTEWFEGNRLFDFKPRQLIACMSVDIDMPGRGLKLRDFYLNLGFEQRGHLKEVGWKKERWIDTLYLQLQLRE